MYLIIFQIIFLQRKMQGHYLYSWKVKCRQHLNLIYQLNQLFYFSLIVPPTCYSFYLFIVVIYSIIYSQALHLLMSN